MAATKRLYTLRSMLVMGRTMELTPQERHALSLFTKDTWQGRIKLDTLEITGALNVGNNELKFSGTNGCIGYHIEPIDYKVLLKLVERGILTVKTLYYTASNDELGARLEFRMADGLSYGEFGEQ